MIRIETKAYENIASDIFSLACNKLKTFEAVAGEIGVSGHYVSDVAKGKYQPTVPMFVACLALVAPWFVEALLHFIRKEVNGILEPRRAAARVVVETRGANVGCMPQGAEQANV